MARRSVWSSRSSSRGVEVAEEAAGEAVARAGGVDHLLERIAGQREEAVLGEQRGAVLALLGDDHARPERHHLARSAHEVRLLGQHAQLGVVHQHQVDGADRAPSESRAVSIQRFIESRPASSAPCTARAPRAGGRAGCSRGTASRPAATRPRASAGSRRRRSAACRRCGRRSGRTRSGRARRTSCRPRPARCRRCRCRGSRSTSYSSSPKSSPTGPTTRTSVKKLAASEKWTAEPPSMRSRSPNGRAHGVEGDRSDHDKAHGRGQTK